MFLLHVQLNFHHMICVTVYAWACRHTFVELHCNKLQKLLESHEGMGNGHVVPLENGAGPSNGILTLSRPRAIVVQQWHPTKMLNAVHSSLLLRSLDKQDQGMGPPKNSTCSRFFSLQHFPWQSYIVDATLQLWSANSFNLNGAQYVPEPTWCTAKSNSQRIIEIASSYYG